MKNYLKNIINNEKAIGWIFILPALLGTFIFIIIPVICSFGLSFAKWDLLNPIEFVGLDNYKAIFSDALFYFFIPLFSRTLKRPFFPVGDETADRLSPRKPYP